MTADPLAYTTIGAASSPSFSCDGRTLFHLRGAGLPQVWALDLDSDSAQQLTCHNEKVALLRRERDKAHFDFLLVDVAKHLDDNRAAVHAAAALG